MNQLTLCMLHLESAIKKMITILELNADIDASIFYDVEPVTTELEESIILNGYSRINVERIQGELAFKKIIDSYSDFYIFNDAISRRFIKKFPGYLVIKKNYDQVDDAIKKVNESKCLFKQEVLRSGDDALERWQQVHDRFNYLVTLAVYRKIYFFPFPVHAAYFNWVTRPRIENISFTEALNKCDLAKNTLPIAHTHQSWHSLLDSEKSMISQYSQFEFTIRRQIKLRPESKVRLINDTRGLGYSAGLPFIFINHPKRTSALGSYDITQPRG
ncbi:MAG: DNA replication terminus site-binding protein, partial [Paraglaciecola sp.]|nr:DNA replication terminus site-binding protein [Paraglaciecola sp.]